MAPFTIAHEKLTLSADPAACLYAVMGANAQKSAAYEKSLTPTSVKRNIVIAGFAFIPEIARIPGANEYRITMFSGSH